MNIIANFCSAIDKSGFLMKKHIVSENKNLFYVRISLTDIFY